MKTHLINPSGTPPGTLGPSQPTFGQTKPAEAALAPRTANSSPAPTPVGNLSPSDRHRIESLKRKQRSDSFVQKLSHEQIAKILGWLNEEEDIGKVHDYITAPAPEGLGLGVSITSVRRLRAHVTANRAKHRATEILDTIIDMEADGGLSPSAQSERIQSAIYQLLHQWAFELVRTEPGAPELRDTLNTIEKLAALDLKRQKIALDREKMLRRDRRASTAPFPRQHHVELKIVPSTPAADSARPRNADLQSAVSPISNRQTILPSSDVQLPLSTAATQDPLHSHHSHPPNPRPPVEIIAPLPEVVL